MHIVAAFGYYEAMKQAFFLQKGASISSVMLSTNTSTRGTKSTWKNDLPQVGGMGKQENLE